MDETLGVVEPLPRRETAAVDPRDRISVRDYIRDVEIGAFKAERGVTQRVRFNVVLEVRAHTAASNDDVDKVLSYDTIVEAIDAQLSTERINLLETLAERIAERCLEDARAVRVVVRIEKLDRIPGALGVEISRTRRAVPVPQIGPVLQADTPEHPRPIVFFLSNVVAEGDDLTELVARLAGADVPSVICLGTVEGFENHLDGWPGRRIGLLSIEQNAWALASRDPRCVVVESRTELDWAMKHQQLSVWAPSKIVLDAVEKPDVDLAHPERLALWLAETLDAARFVLIGSDPELWQGTVEVVHFDPKQGYDALEI